MNLTLRALAALLGYPSDALKANIGEVRAAILRDAVLSIADQDYAMYIIGSMAEIRGFDLAYVIGESFIAEDDLKLRGWGHSDFIVDPDSVRSAVRQLIERLDRKG